MKRLKALGVFISLFGLSCFLLGAYGLFTLESNLRLWEQLQRAGLEGAQSVSLAKLRSGIITHSIWYALIGSLSIVSGVGLFLVKDWARKLWLGVLILLAGINLYWLTDQYLRASLRGADVIGFLIIGLVLTAMWFYFTREQTKGHFRRDR